MVEKFGLRFAWTCVHEKRLYKLQPLPSFFLTIPVHVHCCQRAEADYQLHDKEEIQAVQLCEYVVGRRKCNWIDCTEERNEAVSVPPPKFRGRYIGKLKLIWFNPRGSSLDLLNSIWFVHLWYFWAHHRHKLHLLLGMKMIIFRWAEFLNGKFWNIFGWNHEMIKRLSGLYYITRVRTGRNIWQVFMTGLNLNINYSLF